jgi:hypothetical protein
MRESNKKIFEGMKHIQRVCFGYECLKDNDPIYQNHDLGVRV